MKKIIVFGGTSSKNYINKQLATSPRSSWGGTILEIATKRLPFQVAVLEGTFSLSSFNENFNLVKGITNPELNNQLQAIIDAIVF